MRLERKKRSRLVYSSRLLWARSGSDRTGGAGRTVGDNRFKVDDCAGEGSAVEGAGHFEYREEGVARPSPRRGTVSANSRALSA